MVLVAYKNFVEAAAQRGLQDQIEKEREGKGNVIEIRGTEMQTGKGIEKEIGTETEEGKDEISVQ